jgi:hypothetical protein
MMKLGPLSRVPAGGSAWGEPPPRSADVSTREPVPVRAARSVYSARTNVTTNAPSGEFDGVPAPVGRVWAEARSVITSGSAAEVELALVSTQNGVRCTVTAPVGQTISSGSLRFWVFDDVAQRWSLGAVEETLPTGVVSVATPDLFVTVGGK